MNREDEREAFERKWAALSADVLSEMADWRVQHPRATLTEIEGEVDRRLAGTVDSLSRAHPDARLPEEAQGSRRRQRRRHRFDVSSWRDG